jgi:hypothetical protein
MVEATQSAREAAAEYEFGRLGDHFLKRQIANGKMEIVREAR